MQEKPRVSSETFKIDDLLKLGENTFGYSYMSIISHQYGKFMKDRDFSSDERPIVKYIPDLELAYVY